MFAISSAAISESSIWSMFTREPFWHEHDIRFAASMRIPSTPRESRSLPNSAKRLLTYSSVSVARLSVIWLRSQTQRWTVYHSLGQTEQLAGLHFNPILVIDEEIIWLKSAMVEIMCFVKAGIDIVGVRGSCDARASTSRHMVEYRIYERVF